MVLSAVLSPNREGETTKLSTPDAYASPTLADQMRSFREELELLKSRGVKITPINAVTIAYSAPTPGETTIDCEFIRDLLPLLQSTKGRVGMFMEETPLTLARTNRLLLEASKELRPDIQEAIVTPYELNIEVGNNNKLIIEIKNWLNSEEKATVFRREVTYNDETKVSVLSEVLQGLTVLAGNVTATEERIDKTLTDRPLDTKWKPSITLYEGKTLTEEQHANTQSIFSKTFGNEIAIDILPSGKPVDYYINSTPLKISEAGCIRNNFSPILVDGVCRSISFEIPMKNEIKPVAGTSFRDKFGNRITCSNSKDGVVSVLVEPRIFLSNETNSTSPRGIRVDLSSLGLGTLENFIYQNEVPLVTSLGSKGQYKLFSTCTLPEETSRIPKLGGGITSGISTAERLFGFEPGKLAPNIVVMPSEEANAHFSAGNPDTIVVYFPQLLAGQSQVVGSHEAIHLISHRYGVSGGEWRDWFNMLAKNEDGQTFLTLISESVFSTNVKEAGHAYNNEDEFLASFVNGFRDTNWEKTVKEWPLGIKVIYKDSLLTLESRLQKLTEAYKKSNPPFDPVLLRSKLKERIEIMNKMIFGGE